MQRFDIIRAWKDEEYFSSLSEMDRKQVPQNPAGLVELTDQDLGSAEGGQAFTTLFTISALGTCYSLCTSCITVSCTVTITIVTVSLE